MTIDKFDGEYRFLSNFYPSRVTIDGITYPTAEHAYQAAKTKSLQWKLFIKNLPTPGKAKRAGRYITIREDWEDVKLAVMYNIVKTKFNNNTHLGDLLLMTSGRIIQESNYWGDSFWGVTEDGEGFNHLGKILMQVRDELQADMFYNPPYPITVTST